MPGHPDRVDFEHYEFWRLRHRASVGRLGGNVRPLLPHRRYRRNRCQLWPGAKAQAPGRGINDRRSKIDGEPRLVFRPYSRERFPLTYALNELICGMGLPDLYPFVLSNPAIEKLRFVHEILHNRAQSQTEDKDSF